jgi:hypothetical protein
MKKSVNCSVQPIEWKMLFFIHGRLPTTWLHAASRFGAAVNHYVVTG